MHLDSIRSLTLVGSLLALLLLPGLAIANPTEVVAEDVLYCPELDLTPEYRAHVEGIIRKRQEICAKIRMDAYPDVENFFGIELGKHEVLDEFRAHEQEHFRQLLDPGQLAEALEFAARVQADVARLRSDYPLSIEPRIKARSVRKGTENVIELSVPVPSMLYRLEAELKQENGVAVLYLTIIRPSDQQLHATETENGVARAEIRTATPLARATIRWRTLKDSVPFDLRFDELGEMAF